MIFSSLTEKKRIVEEVHDKKFDEHYDVIIVGLGTAGVMAALASAGKGQLKILGIERDTSSGGMSTTGAVIGYYFGSRGGMFESVDDIVEKNKENGQGIAAYTESGYSKNIEIKKLILEELFKNNNIQFLYEASICGVYLEDRKVVGIEWTGPAGCQNASAKVLIDATGDAIVAVMAGAETRSIGRDFDNIAHTYQAVRVYVDSQHKTVHRFKDDGFVDISDAEDLSHEITESMTHHLEDSYETNSDILLYYAPQLGINEGRLIVGEETLCLTQFLNEEYTDRPIFYSYSNLDNHARDTAFESEVQQDWNVACSLWGINFTVPVPYGALVPQGVEGLLVAGRCISSEHDMAVHTRMQRDMQKTGEAAGTAARLAVEGNFSVKGLPFEKLIEKLEESGCLNADERVIFREVYSHDEDLNIPFEWYTDVNRIQSVLCSRKPGIAIWSAKRIGGTIKDTLKQWMQFAENEKNDGRPIHLDYLEKNCAITLALLGDDYSLPLLRTMAAKADPFIPETSRKRNAQYGYIAIYLLGKLHDTDAIDLLITILDTTEKYISNNRSHDLIEKYDDTNYLGKTNELIFQYKSYALTALFKIGSYHEKYRTMIGRALDRIVSSDQFRLINELSSITGVDAVDKRRISFDLTATVRIVTAAMLNEWQIPSRLFSILNESDRSIREKTLLSSRLHNGAQRKENH